MKISKFKKFLTYSYSKLISGFLFLLIFSPVIVQASNPITNFGTSIWNAYNTNIIQPLSRTIGLLFFLPVYIPPLTISHEISVTNTPKKAATLVPKSLTSSQKIIYVNNGSSPVTYVTNNYPTTTVYQSGGSGGGGIDTSVFVARQFFDKQILIVLDSASKKVSDLRDALGVKVNTGILSVTNDANIGGDLTVIGNIIGNVIGTINPSFALGSIPFQGASGLAEDNANFFWDETNSRLGIGTNTPTVALDVVGDFKIDGSVILPSLVSGVTPTTNYWKLSSGESIMILRDDPTYHTSGLITGLDLFFGRNAGNLTATGGGNNIGIGDAALNALTSGYGNVAIGLKASLATTSGNYNIGIGPMALANNTASGIVGVGYQALGANTSGGFNTALGNSALAGNTTGSYNTAIGADAQRNTTTSPTGSHNVSVGGATLRYLTSGSQNAALGYHTGHSTSSGSNNSYLGFSAGRNNTIGSNNIFIGSNSGIYSSTASDQIFINSIDRISYSGDQNESPIYIQQNATVANQLIALNGKVGINNVTPSVALDVVGNMKLRSYGSGTNSGTPTYILQVDADGDIIESNDFTGTITPSGFTQGSVVFAGSGGTLTQDNSGFFYDATNHSLGLGTTSPYSDFGLFQVRGAKVASTFSGGVLASIREASTYNTSGGVKTSYAFHISNQSTRASGASSLTNVGLYATASGAQNNYAALFDQGDVGIGTLSPTYRLEVIGTFRASGNALIGTNTSAGTATPINLSLGGTYGSNAAGAVGNLKIDMYNDGTANRSGFGVSANRLEYQTPAGTAHAMYVGGNLIQSIDDNAVLIKSGLYSTSTYTQRIGDMLTQSYGINNITIVDNGYYNGSSFTRVRSGFASGIQMYNGHLMMIAGATGTGTFTPTYPFKANSVGTVGIGGDGGNVANTFTGNTLVATSTAVGIGDSTPDYRLDVANTAIDNNIFSLTDSDGECLYNPEAGGVTVSCSSDARLKTNVVGAASALAYFSDFDIKDYNVIASGDLTTGVIAQEMLLTHPELVSLGADGMYKVQMPNQWKVIKSIQELDIKIVGLSSLDISSSNSLGSLIKQFLADISNGLESLFVKKVYTEELCVKKSDGSDICVTGDQLDQIINGNNNTGGGSGGGNPPAGGDDTGNTEDGSGNTGNTGGSEGEEGSGTGEGGAGSDDTGSSGDSDGEDSASSDNGGSPPSDTPLPSDEPQP